MANQTDGGAASEAKTVRVDMYGFIGEDWWEPENSNTAKTLLSKAGELKSGDTLQLHINSGGGDFFEGLSIYNNLLAMASKGVTVETYVDGLAASAASTIFLGGTKRVVGSAAMVMIHNVWSWAVGDAKAMERAAADLHQFNDTAAIAYADRSNETKESALELMDAETWMSGDEALTRGFATEVLSGSDDNNKAAAKACILPMSLKNAPAWLKEPRADKRVITPDMMLGRRPSQVEPRSEAPPQKKTEVDASVQPQETKMDKDELPGGGQGAQDPQAAVVAERTRNKAVREAIDNAFDKKLITEEDKAYLVSNYLDAGKSLADAREAILNKIEATAAKEPEGRPAFTAGRVTVDGRDKFIAGIANSIMSQSGYEKRDAKNEFNGIGLKGIAAACLERQGIRGSGSMSGSKLAATIFNIHTTGDFPLIMENIAGKSMLKGYEELPEVYEKLVRRTTVSDFKINKAIGVGLFPSLGKVEEGAEYEFGTTGERGAQISVAKYGRLWQLTEETIINDDRDALTVVPNRMGQAAKRTVGNIVWSQILDNPVFNSQAIFHSSRGNIRTSSAFNVANLEAAWAAFTVRAESTTASTAGVDANINIEPAFLLVPKALQLAADRLMVQPTINGTNGELGGTPNVMAGKYEVVSDGRMDRISATRWFQMSNPNMFDTLQLAALEGRFEPEFLRAEEWRNDSIVYRVKLPGIAAGWLDYVGAQRNDA
jgi:ATP-dependent protease ClpP protease subunit